MKVAVYSTKPYERPFFEAANEPHGHTLTFLESRLTASTTRLAAGQTAACVFTADVLDAPTLAGLFEQGVRLVALRCAGFNQVDLEAAERTGMTIARVPAYSPYAVAEHTVALILALNRKTHRSFVRVREQNFDLNGLMGFDLHGRTVGVVGTGKIGLLVAKIMLGFGCRVIACDPVTNPRGVEMGIKYLPLQRMIEQSDIITLHSPLTPHTHHLIDDEVFSWMKPGAMLINTSRGAIVDTKAAIRALKSGHLAHFGLDVYEEESDLFFKDLSGTIIQDDVFARLTTFPNVLITAHQAFFTREALTNIADTTLQNITDFAQGAVSPTNLVTAALVAG